MAAKEYFIIFTDQAEQSKFVDEFGSAAMNNLERPLKIDMLKLMACSLVLF